MEPSSVDLWGGYESYQIQLANLDKLLPIKCCLLHVNGDGEHGMRAAENRGEKKRKSQGSPRQVGQ